jgi:hypothetical protein
MMVGRRQINPIAANPISSIAQAKGSGTAAGSASINSTVTEEMVTGPFQVKEADMCLAGNNGQAKRRRIFG